MKLVKKLVLVVSPMLLVACGSIHQPPKWIDTKPVAVDMSVPEGKASIVIYRMGNVIDGPTINTYIGGEYLASLEHGAYSQESICATNQRLYAQFTHQDDAYLQKANSGRFYNIEPNKVNYFKIVAVNNRPDIVAVTSEQAILDLKGLNKQSHTLRRVESDCNNVLQKFNLEASALFKFNGSSYQSVLPQGKTEIDNIINAIKSETADISRIVVVGHTDPEGSIAYNNQLSKKRAETVKQMLVKGGISAESIETDGRGKSELLVTDCRARFARNVRAITSCDQPNRRVEIILEGQKAVQVK